MTSLARLFGALVLLAAAPTPVAGSEVSPAAGAPETVDRAEPADGALAAARAELPSAPRSLARAVSEVDQSSRDRAADHARVPVRHLRPRLGDGPWTRPGRDVPRMDDDDDPAPAA